MFEYFENEDKDSSAFKANQKKLINDNFRALEVVLAGLADKDAELTRELKDLEKDHQRLETNFWGVESRVEDCERELGIEIHGGDSGGGNQPAQPIIQ